MDRLDQVMQETLDLLNPEQAAMVADIKDCDDRWHTFRTPLPPDERWFPRIAKPTCDECNAELPRKSHDALCPACRERKMERMRERVRRRRELREVDVDLAPHH